MARRTVIRDSTGAPVFTLKRGPPKPRAKRDNPEERYQCAVVEYLQFALPEPYDFYASMVGVNVGRATGARLKKMGVRADWSDLTIVNLDTGACRWLELKWDQPLSEGQKKKAARLGAKWATARKTLEQVEAALIGWGIKPRCPISRANRLDAIDPG